MNEIEVKAILKDKEKIIEHLKKIGVKFCDTKYQKDIAFWPNDIKNLNTHKLGRNFLRIREQESNGKREIIFTLKQPQTNQTDCIEHEIEIKENDIPSLKLIISSLGYYEYVTIEKTRITAKIKDIEICIDDVTDLGSYIELEKFAPAHQAESIQKELYSILESWGINKDDYVYDGYDILVRNAQKK
jgi:adenylate cyclase class 2